ncbi:hypothetical protein RB195_001302 [Necator americanus]|uniref:Aminotransferase class I/classII domain-containing protein n=1 Tax=Necator americanus TaxID=51031 RepID=A0ABR1DDP6_NECAM
MGFLSGSDVDVSSKWLSCGIQGWMAQRIIRQAILLRSCTWAVSAAADWDELLDICSGIMVGFLIDVASMDSSIVMVGLWYDVVDVVIVVQIISASSVSLQVRSSRAKMVTVAVGSISPPFVVAPIDVKGVHKLRGVGLILDEAYGMFIALLEGLQYFNEDLVVPHILDLTLECCYLHC